MSQQVQITFNIEYPEERRAAMRCMKATDAYLALWEMQNKLRDVWKYSDVEIEVHEAEKWRDVLSSCMEKFGIDLDEELD